MKILVLGDSYCPASASRSAFDGLVGHDVEFLDVSDEPDWRPSSASERKLREYLGSPAQVIAALDDHDALVVQGAPISAEVIEAAPRLRIIGVMRGGPVNVDIDAASARGIPVVTAPGKNAPAVAELTIGMMVMIARRVPGAWRHVEAGGEVYVDNYEGAGWYGQELAGRTLGLVGFGRIGQRVTALAVAFGMRVLAFDPYVDPGDISARGAEPAASLDAVLESADFVSLHARATPETAGMIDARRFSLMRRGSFFVNTARHSMVDEDALESALRSGHLAGAALDVASPSPAGKPHRLAAMPNVMLLPHIGGATLDTIVTGGRMAAAEIARLAADEALVNVANAAALDGTPAAR